MFYAAAIFLYEAAWNAAGLPSGIYFYQIRTDDLLAVRKMVLIMKKGASAFAEAPLLSSDARSGFVRRFPSCRNHRSVIIGKRSCRLTGRSNR